MHSSDPQSPLTVVSTFTVAFLATSLLTSLLISTVWSASRFIALHQQRIARLQARIYDVADHVGDLADEVDNMRRTLHRLVGELTRVQYRPERVVRQRIRTVPFTPELHEGENVEAVFEERGTWGVESEDYSEGAGVLGSEDEIEIDNEDNHHNRRETYGGNAHSSRRPADVDVHADADTDSDLDIDSDAVNVRHEYHHFGFDGPSDQRPDAESEHSSHTGVEDVEDADIVDDNTPASPTQSSDSREYSPSGSTLGDSVDGRLNLQGDRYAGWPHDHFEYFHYADQDDLFPHLPHLHWVGGEESGQDQRQDQVQEQRQNHDHDHAVDFDHDYQQQQNLHLHPDARRWQRRGAISHGTTVSTTIVGRSEPRVQTNGRDGDEGLLAVRSGEKVVVSAGSPVLMRREAHEGYGEEGIEGDDKYRQQQQQRDEELLARTLSTPLEWPLGVSTLPTRSSDHALEAGAGAGTRSGTRVGAGNDAGVESGPGLWNANSAASRRSGAQTAGELPARSRRGADVDAGVGGSGSGSGNGNGNGNGNASGNSNEQSVNIDSAEQQLQQRR